LFKSSLKWCWNFCRYVGLSMMKARLMVSCEGMPCFRVNIVLSCCWWCSAKFSMSSKSCAFAMVAKNDMPIISWSMCFIFPFWRWVGLVYYF
jgi:hypothetical protein